MDVLKHIKCLGRIHFSELFPTKWSSFIFVSYMVLFVNQGLLVTATQKADNGYSYNTIVAVLATEVVKLVLSIILYAKDHHLLNIVKDSKSHLKVMYQYFIPAFLYCLYNNLAFVNLSAFDPTTYYLLLQLRVVVTGLLFQILFNKKLSPKQWMSLVFLTAGCMIKQLSFGHSETSSEPPVTDSDVLIKPVNKGTTSLLSVNMMLILIQVVCSCLAGVYNEFLLKSANTEACNIYIQNVFMYLDSIMCNVILLLWRGELPVLWDSGEIQQLFDAQVLLVILNNAAIGIVTSFFLRSLNSILKTFASALELIFTAILTWLLFGIPVYINTLCAIFVVTVAVIIYSQNPVVNVKPAKELTQKENLPV